MNSGTGIPLGNCPVPWLGPTLTTIICLHSGQGRTNGERCSDEANRALGPEPQPLTLMKPIELKRHHRKSVHCRNFLPNLTFHRMHVFYMYVASIDWLTKQSPYLYSACLFLCRVDTCVWYVYSTCTCTHKCVLIVSRIRNLST